jgi:hypothetical protein
MNSTLVFMLFSKSQFINCCTDSLLMTHHGGLSLNIIIWRIGGGAKFPFALGPKNSLGGPGNTRWMCSLIHICIRRQ